MKNINFQLVKKQLKLYITVYVHKCRDFLSIKNSYKKFLFYAL